MNWRRLGKNSVVALALGVSIMALGTGAGLAAPPAAADAGTATRAERPMNVLFIIADDMAARLGSYGAPVRTPNLDRLASQGVSFDRAYAQFPWCAPSRASFLTGTRPDTTRVMDLSTPFRQALPDIKTLPQYFKDQGYYSGRVGKIFHQGVPGDIGLGGPDDTQSWTEVVNPRGRDKDAENGALINMTPGIPYGSAMAYLADDGADEEQTDGKVATAAIDMLKANKDKPFFIGVGFYRPHVPEVAPKKYFDLYPLEKIRIADETPDSLAKVLPAAKAWTPDHFGMSPDEQRRMIQAYSAATSFMDAQVGRVLASLKELGLEDNTIVVFTSDHGFMLGEHGQWMKNILWEDSARVPLIVRTPGMAKAGTRSDRTVELLDLYPTLTSLAGLPHYDRNEGQSLEPLLTDPADPKWTKPALSQVRGGRSVRTVRWRYTEWEEGGQGRELYDHQADPGEHRNLAQDPAYATTVAELKALLPKGPVEKRPKPVSYDPIRDCLVRPLSKAPEGDGKKPPAGGEAKGGGEGGGAAKVCSEIDP